MNFVAGRVDISMTLKSRQIQGFRLMNFLLHGFALRAMLQKTDSKSSALNILKQKKYLMQREENRRMAKNNPEHLLVHGVG